MRWRRRGGRSRDVVVRRGRFGGGGGGGMPMGGVVGVPALLILGVVFLVNVLGGGGSGGAGIDDVLDQLDPARQPAGGAPPAGAGPDGRLVKFMSFVLDDAQRYWERSFAESNREYERAKLVIFQGGTQSACGGATSDIGPHYCPPDGNVYLDLAFFQDLSSRFGAPGDFAQAYVLAHEIGHHVQNLLGINADVRRAQEDDPDEANALSIKLELQADCFAGVWGSTTAERGILEPGDLEEGLRAAASVGDDRIQEQSGGSVNPETWTHGSSEQRVEWFRRGFDTGDPQACDTFSG